MVLLQLKVHNPYCNYTVARSGEASFNSRLAQDPGPKIESLCGYFGIMLAIAR